MSDSEVNILAALIAGYASLIVAIVTALFSWFNQREIEKLKHDLAESKAEKDAKRDYDYEARKRLYEQCGPLLFQMAELAEAAYFRITGLAQTGKEGNLDPNGKYFLSDEYYRCSTIFRILAPSAALKILQRRLTLVDLSLDVGVWRQYVLARQVFLTFGDEFTLAKMGRAPQPYDPFHYDSEALSRTEPAKYRRQGLPLGVMEPAIEAIISGDKNDERVLTYAEFEAEYKKGKSNLRRQIDEISFLVDGFHPRSRPVFWRILVSQACLYRILSAPAPLQEETWRLETPLLPASEREKFDWRSPREQGLSQTEISEPLDVADEYLLRSLKPRLQRIGARKH